MTLPDEEMRALSSARAFLFALLDPAKTPRVPRAIRQRARDCLRHYPYQHRVEDLYRHGLCLACRGSGWAPAGPDELRPVCPKCHGTRRSPA